VLRRRWGRPGPARLRCTSPARIACVRPCADALLFDSRARRSRQGAARAASNVLRGSARSRLWNGKRRLASPPARVAGLVRLVDGRRLRVFAGRCGAVNVRLQRG
jgi:hypothetical protein